MGRDKMKQWEERQKLSRAETLAAAEALLAQDQFDEAEKLVRAMDADIQGTVALARLYEKRLTALVEAGARDKAQVERVFERAKHWAWSAYPEPHTQMEADDYRAGREEDLARLVKILGYEPRR